MCESQPRPYSAANIAIAATCALRAGAKLWRMVVLGVERVAWKIRRC